MGGRERAIVRDCVIVDMAKTVEEFIQEIERDAPHITGNDKQVKAQLLFAQQEYDSVIKIKSLEDLFLFNKYVLGIEGGQGKTALASFHKEICHFVTDNTKKKKLMLVPRGHLKSTLITIGYCVQQIIKNPNIRILIRSATWQMAVDFLTEVKNHLQKNEELIRLFGDVTVDAQEWSQDRITLKRDDTNVKGPTVWAMGIEGNLVGSHPDLIIDDDLVNRENVRTPEGQQKVILKYKDTLDLLEVGGQYILIGTRWSEGDLYGWILDTENDIKKSYDVLIRQAFEGNIETGDGFVSLWPEKFTLKELQTRLREKGWYEFSAQYLNNCIPDEAATFKRGWFKYYDMLDIRGKTLNKYIMVDPAISLKRDADYTAMIVVGIDQFQNIYVLDIVRGHWTPAQIISAMFSLFELWHPICFGLETVAYQKALSYSLKEEMQKRGRYMSITELLPNERTKDQRIKGLQPLYENGKVHHRKDLLLNWALEGELTSFPRGKNDDMIDAFAYVLDFLVPPKEKKSRYHHRYLYGPRARY